MKNYLKRVPAALLALLLMVSLLPLSALAAGVAAPVVELPVSVETDFALADQTDTDDLPKDDVYTFQLKENGAVKDTLTITGEGSDKFVLTYDRVGVHEYTISQVEGENVRGHYDDTVYTVKVTITNAEGGGLEAAVAMREAGKQTKLDVAEFVNKYDPIMKDVTVTKKWVGGSKRPDVTVDLLVGDEVVASGTMNEKNDWAFTFRNAVRAKDNSWKIRERTIAGRYVPKYQYDYKYDRATVTNTYTEDLIQTGQLNWPIPVLCVLGGALMILGFCLLFKKREDTCE